VALERIPWTFPHFPDITRRPPYDPEVIKLVKTFADGRDFTKPCQIDFQEFLVRETPLAE